MDIKQKRLEKLEKLMNDKDFYDKHQLQKCIKMYKEYNRKPVMEIEHMVPKCREQVKEIFKGMI